VRFFSVIFLIACGGDASDGLETPPPVGEQGVVNGPSADNVPIAGDGEVQARVSGVVSVPDFNGQVIQFDALADFEGQSVVVANERYDAPGEFRLVVRGEHESIDIIVYLDVDGDGPSQGDFRYEYVNNPIALNPTMGEIVEISGLEITVVDSGEVTSGGPAGAETPLVEGVPEEPPGQGVPEQPPGEVGVVEPSPEGSSEAESAPTED
jgi:hypothetical protein